MKTVSNEELAAFLAEMDAGRRVVAGSETHRVMSLLSLEAQRITAALNGGFHEPEAVRALMATLTGRPIDPTFRLFPPFHTDCGKNLRIGKGVFINAGCHFQDQGGVTLGDGCLIGHGAAMVIKDRLLDESDGTQQYICGNPNCGHIAIHDRRGALYCPVCKNNTNIYLVQTSYAFKLLMDELLSLGVAMRLQLEDLK